MIAVLDDQGPKYISQFEVESWAWRINPLQGAENLQAMTVTLTLKLQFFGIFIVTYLPTILMNIINQATNYISGDSAYDLIITVNITSMMVLASIYLSVSTSLPSTPNIKPVEIWLLFNLGYPFLNILVNIILQVKSISISKNHFLHFTLMNRNWLKRNEIKFVE